MPSNYEKALHRLNEIVSSYSTSNMTNLSCPLVPTPSYPLVLAFSSADRLFITGKNLPTTISTICFVKFIGTFINKSEKKNKK